MRVAEICPVCATYINAACIIYNGDYLSNIDVAPLTTLDEILGDINDAFAAETGTGVPTDIPDFIGQFYINTSVPALYIGLSDSVSNWGFVATLITTTTTTTTIP